MGFGCDENELGSFTKNEIREVELFFAFEKSGDEFEKVFFVEVYHFSFLFPFWGGEWLHAFVSMVGVEVQLSGPAIRK